MAGLGAIKWKKPFRNGWFLCASLLGLLLAVSACHRSGPESAPAPAAEAPSGAFNPALFDVERPCSYVTEADAAAIGGAPYYRTLSMNQISDGRIRCARAVGEFGLQSVLTAEVLYPVAENAVESTFSAECQGAPAAPADPQTPLQAIAQPHCQTAGGAVILKAAKHVIRIQVRGGAGEADPAATQNLARLVAGRVTQYGR